MFENIKNFFESIGWAANLITIGAILLSTISLVLKRPRNWLIRKFKRTKFSMKYHSIYEFIQKSSYSQKGNVDPKDLKILILDDEPGHYPIEYLRDARYDIENREKISLSKIDELLKYKIIILDIAGIVEEDLKQGGFELLKRLRDKKPYGQAIIAASSKRFDMSVADFYKSADKKIKTPIEAIEIEAVLDEVANSKFSISDIAKCLDEIITKVNNDTIKEKLISLSILFLQGECDFSEIEKEASLYLHKDQISEFIFSINSINGLITNERNN